MSRPLRILHCPEMVAGNAYGLSLAERRLGLESRSVAARQNKWRFEADEILFNGSEGPIRSELRYWGLLIRALLGYDVIHYNFGRSIIMPFVPRHIRSGERRYPRVLNFADDCYRRVFGMIDLPILKRAGKVIFVTYQGMDARQVGYCRANFSIYDTMEIDQASLRPSSPLSERMDDVRRRNIAFFARYADRIFALNPDLLRVLPSTATFLPYTSVDPAEWRPEPDAIPSERLTVMHAPSGRAVKGTRYILSAVEKLRREGLDFEFRLVENIPRSEVKRVYRQADILVDQLLAGWYGGLAVELMALAKPVIAYIREEDLQFIPAEMRADLPVINSNPYTIYQVLKACLTMDRAQLQEIGARSRAYMEKWHDPLKIAAQLRDEAINILEQRRGSRFSGGRA